MPWRAIRRSALIALAAIVALAAILLTGLHTPPARTYILSRIQQLAAASGVRLDASSFDFNLFTGWVELRDVRLRSGPQETRPFLVARRIQIEVRVWELVGGSLSIQDAAAEALAVDLFTDAQGRSNLPSVGASQGPPTDELPAFLISHLAANGSFLFEDARNRAALRIPAWRFELQGQEAPFEERVQFDADPTGSLEYAGKQLPLTETRIRARFDRHQVQIEQMRLAIKAAEVAVSGNVNGFADPELRLNLDTGFDLEPLLTFADLSLSQPASGRLRAAIQTSGKLSALQATADVSSENLGVQPFHDIRAQVQLRWQRTNPTAVDIVSAAIRAPEGTVLAAGAWQGAGPEANNRLSARIQSLDLEGLARTLQLPVAIASTASGSVDVQWRGTDFEDASADARLQVIPARQTVERRSAPVSGVLSAHAQNRRLTLTAESLQSMGTTLDAELQAILDHKPGWDGALSGTVHGRLARVQDTVTGLRRFQDEQGVPPAFNQPITGNVEVVVSLGGSLHQPRATAELSGSGLQYGPLKNISLQTEASYDPALLRLTRATLRWEGVQIDAAGNLALLGANSAITFRATTTEIPVPQLLAAGGLTLPVTGQVAATIQAEGTLDQPSISVDLTGQDLTAYGEPLGALTSRIALNGKTLQLESLQIDRPEAKGTLTADGSVQMETRDYTFRAQGRRLFLSTLQVPGAETVRATIDASAEGTGNLDNPSASVNLRAESIQWQGRDLGSLRVQATAADHAALTTLDAPMFGVHAEARARTEAPYPLDVRLTAQDTDLSLLSPAVHGHVTAQLEASGDPEHWRDGSASITVSQLLVETDAGPFRNTGDLQLSYENRLVKVLAATLSGPMAKLSLNGELPLDQTAPAGSIQYQAQADLASLLPPTDKNAVSAQGQVRLEGKVQGSLASLSPSGTLRLESGSIIAPGLKSPIQAIQLGAALDRGLLTVEQLHASLGDGAVTAHGTIPLSLFSLPRPLEIPTVAAPAQFTLNVSPLSLASLVNLPEQVTGQIGLTVEADALRPDLAAVQAKVTLDQASFDLAGISLKAAAPPVITLRDGVVQVDRFQLQGENSEIQLSGSSSLSERDLRGLRLNGHMDAALLGGLASDLSTAGMVQLDVTARGKWDQPEFTGRIEVANGQVNLPSPRVDVSSLNLRLALQGGTLAIETLRGDVNGGTLTATGSVGLLPQIQPDVTLRASNVYLDFPAGLRTLSDLDLKLQPQQEQLLLSGQINIEEGSYAELLDLQSLIQRYLQSGGGLQLAEERSALLDRLRFDVAVQTKDPVVMDNNLGKIAFGADLRLLGGYYRPGLTGRVAIEEGGTLRLQENDYGIEQGSIDFVNEAQIEPLLNIQASTKVRDRTITVDITTDPKGEISTNFTSDKADDTRADIVSLLLTGRAAEELQGSELNTAGGEAAASLLAGSVTGRLSQELQGTLGLSRVRIEPDLISAETDPTARLTIGQDLTKALELIYSMNLRDSSDQIWVVRYQLARRFSTQATKQEDNTYRFDFKHDLRFGGIRAAPTAKAAKKDLRIGTVTFTGDRQIPDTTLARTFKIKTGDRYDFFALRKALDRLGSYYHDEGYLEAKLRTRREQNGAVDLTMDIDAGRRVDFAFESWTPSGSVRNRIRDDWQHGAFDSQRADTALAQIRRALAKDGYLKPDLEYGIAESDGRKHVTFLVDRGKRYEGAQLVFDGAKGIAPQKLEEQLRRAKLTSQIESNPVQVRNFLAQYYRQEGFLDASVAGPEYRFEEETSQAQIHFTINEGPAYRWGEFGVQGESVYTPAELQKISGVQAGGPYTPQAAQDSHDRIEEAYWKKGYRDVVVDYRLAKRPESGQIDVTAGIQEGPQSIVQKVEVQGTDQTSPSFVTKQIGLKPGDVLDYTKTTQSRRDLYNTGAFSSVDLRAEPVEENPDVAAQLKYVRLLADVHERTPFQIRYGGFFDTDRGPGLIVDFWNRNSLGGGRVIGGRLRYDGDVHEARAFFSQPLLRSFPLRTDTSTFFRREFESTFITDRIGVSVQQAVRLRNKFLLTYGYRFERDHTYDTDPDAFIPFDETLRVAPLTATLTRDSRDDVLDATHGSFTSHSVEYALGELGSSLHFAKYFGQYFHYLPLTAPAPVPFGKGRERSRVVYAGGIRVGLAKGLGGQEVIPTERFFAGGGTTIRGFKQSTLGPVDFLGKAEGGDAVLIINNEVRFPLFQMFEGVGFVDIGNVYSKLSDFSIVDVRKTGGAGLRVRTPYFLLRLDYGFKFDRQPGENRGALFFSIGQAY